MSNGWRSISKPVGPNGCQWLSDFSQFPPNMRVLSLNWACVAAALASSTANERIHVRDQVIDMEKHLAKGGQTSGARRHRHADPARPNLAERIGFSGRGS